ncbi:MAG: hypothetical protein KGQ59_09405, partial [Bdellovibrionales bacterium]|nr:hypothetical protein [Bdellovibrionales bacterium]
MIPRRYKMYFFTTFGVAAFLAGQAQSSDFAWTPARILQAIETLEQVAIDRRQHDSLAPLVDSRLSELSQIAIEKFQKETGIMVSDRPSDGGWNAREMNEWARLLRTRSNQERCDLLRLAYSVSISRLSLMKPSISNPPSFPLQDQEREAPEYDQDVQRALWEFRYFWVLRADSPWSGSECMDFTYPKFSVVHEARMRLEFLESGGESGTTRIYRWPIGRAKKMCGRPFHTHYADHLAIKDPAREISADPIELGRILDPGAFEK